VAAGSYFPVAHGAITDRDEGATGVGAADTPGM